MQTSDTPQTSALATGLCSASNAIETARPASARAADYDQWVAYLEFIRRGQHSHIAMGANQRPSSHGPASLHPNHDLDECLARLGWIIKDFEQITTELREARRKLADTSHSGDKSASTNLGPH